MVAVAVAVDVSDARTNSAGTDVSITIADAISDGRVVGDGGRDVCICVGESVGISVSVALKARLRAGVSLGVALSACVTVGDDVRVAVNV